MKATRRLVLLAAAQLCCAGLLSETALASAATVWADLWRTPDQQGQALLEAGEAAQAAARFHDPRRRAYADLEAGRNAAAVRLLGPFSDPTSEYNLGNAFAKTGQLPLALAAYDAALKQAPADKDIRHNRDLVERELRRLQQSPRSSPGNGRQGGRAAASPGQPPQQRSGGQQGGSQPQGSGAGPQHPGPHAGQAAGGQVAANGARAGAGQKGSAGQRPESPQASNRSFGRSRDSAAQVRRDAAFAAAMARAQGSRMSGTSESGRMAAGKAPDTMEPRAGSTQTPGQKPESEQQLALDQWLRQIPDSPAGLLRRKFMIQYMLKHPDASQEEPQ